MALVILVNNGSSNGLLPDGTKPLPEPIQYSLTIQSSMEFCCIHLTKILQQTLKISIPEMIWKFGFGNVKLVPHLPVANEFYKYSHTTCLLIYSSFTCLMHQRQKSQIPWFTGIISMSVVQYEYLNSLRLSDEYMGGGTRSGGVQLRGLNPYPILGKTGLRKHTLF